jgi:dolichyl-phosphooligosaccharide-protein glycotransferase
MEDKDDDEISIDFSKITRFFKRGKKLEDKQEPVSSIPSSNAKEETTPATASPEQGLQKKAEPSQDEKKDDEITMDFGKVKNIFKRKDALSKEHKEIAKGDDEISIDFSKIKNIKNLFKKREMVDDKDDDLSIDFRKIYGFLFKHRVLLLLLIPIFLSIFLRVQPAFLPITDRWASDSVFNNIRSQISSQVNQDYPNLPAQNKDALIENELQKLLQEQKTQIEGQIAATSNFFKSRLQDDNGQTYLLAIDPYFWMRHAKNILENGHPGDEIRNNEPWDNHMYAPGGRGIPFDMFHAYFEAFLFRLLHFFNRNLTLMAVAFYVPVLISALAVIPAFFITKKIAGNFGGFIAAIIVAIHPSFLTRTAGGFSDTDAYNVMFPLFIAWFFLEALEAKNPRKTAILSTVAGLLVGLYSFTWGGWWYIFDFVLISAVFYIAYYSFAHRKELKANFIGFTKQKAIKNSLIFLAIFFTVSAISASYFVNFGSFITFALNPIGFAKLKEVGITTIWPNVFTTVAEQNPASLDSVINQLGLGKFYFFLIALMGITLTMTKREHKKLWFVVGALGWYLIIFLLRSRPFVQDLNTFLVLISIPIIIRIIVAVWESDTEIDIKYAILLILWFIATTFASTKGVRFTLLLVPAFAIGFGIALGELYKYATHWTTRSLHVHKYVAKVSMILVLLLIAGAIPVPFPPFCIGTTCSNALSTSRQEIPSFNDAWALSLDKIREDSQPDAIINSWWDFGHWFKFWADRAVTFDGTSQNTPQAHWIGNALLTSDEETAIGILRMLACSGYSGGTRAFDTLSDFTEDGAKAVDIIYETIPNNRDEAKKVLLKYVDENAAEKVLESTHCEPPENYFITSDDMVGKSGVWAHFGSWDFNRALIYNTLKKKEYRNNADKSVNFLNDRFNYSDGNAEDLFYEVQSITDSNSANNWIAPWPGYAGSASCSNLDSNTLSCSVAGIPLIFNLTAHDSYALGQGGEKVHPKVVSFPTNGSIMLKDFNESTITLQNGRNLGVALVKDGNSYQVIAMDSALTGSMFTRLFYQDGVGLKHFNKLSDERSVFGGRILVWKVDWGGKEIGQIQTQDLEESRDSLNQTSSDEPTEENQTAGLKGNDTETKDGTLNQDNNST